MWNLTDYYADWCGPCQAMKPALDKFETEYSGKVTVTRVDVDQDQAAAVKNNVMGIPTFIIFKDDVEMGRRSGAMPYEEFKSWVDSVVK
ncbi:thioredoxin family protein [Patescibacteria group bacterium]|nr:thioredoxin family protein [Patescibacteria group bacterium]MBU1970281.1 thioredoxin family protein [Patescibacteria group bacterium]